MDTALGTFDIDEVSLIAARSWMRTQEEAASSDVFKETSNLIFEAVEHSYSFGTPVHSNLILLMF